MITVLFDKFLTALEKEVERRNKVFGDQGVNWNVTYPFARGKSKEECVMVECVVSKKKRRFQSTMSYKEFEMNATKPGEHSPSEDQIPQIVTFFVDLVTNKARGDLMI